MLAHQRSFLLYFLRTVSSIANLTDKQKRFCEEYLIDLNATQAAIRAGYSKKTADRIASENLKKLEIQNYLNGLMEKRSEDTGITAEKVVKELEIIAFSDVEITAKEKIKALELLGKHLGMFVERKDEKPMTETEIPTLYKALEGDINDI